MHWLRLALTAFGRIEVDWKWMGSGWEVGRGGGGGGCLETHCAVGLDPDRRFDGVETGMGRCKRPDGK